MILTAEPYDTENIRKYLHAINPPLHAPLQTALPSPQPQEHHPTKFSHKQSHSHRRDSKIEELTQ